MELVIIQISKQFKITIKSIPFFPLFKLEASGLKLNCSFY